MAAYKGSVELISGITQKNGGKFPLMAASAIQFDDTGARMDAVVKDIQSKVGNLEGGSAVPAISEEEIAGCFK